MSSGLDQPLQIYPIFRERVWGRESLAPFFSENPGNKRIGEVWFTFEENLTSSGKTLGEVLRSDPGILGEAADRRHPGICPLLLKLIFTSERLSVQVHPGDEYAERHHDSLGKTEAWYVLDSQPPGEVAVGFKEELTRERLKRAVQSAEIERLLDWRKVHTGETIFVPAGTVHAIGAGLTICEVQENSDITFRLYDYGRPRELHLEDGLQVASLGLHKSVGPPVPLTNWRDHLVECKYFRMERLRLKAQMRIGDALPFYLLLLCTQGGGTIGGEPFRPGQIWLLPAHHAEVEVNGPGSEWILTYTADEPVSGLHAG